MVADGHLHRTLAHRVAGPDWKLNWKMVRKVSQEKKKPARGDRITGAKRAAPTYHGRAKVCENARSNLSVSDIRPTLPAVRHYGQPV